MFDNSNQMAPWVRKTFVDFLPKYLFIKRPEQEDDDDESNNLDGMYGESKQQMAVKSEGKYSFNLSDFSV